MRETNTHIYFWGGIYSQWFKSSFKDETNIKYETAEQFMMYNKALLFGDSEIANQILKTNNPKTQKDLGRKVKGFQQSIWDANKFDIIVQGNILKFSQNKKLKKQILETGNKVLVEGSPIDTIYGVGLKYSDPRILNSDLWRGQNLLGEALMKVRDILTNELK